MSDRVDSTEVKQASNDNPMVLEAAVALLSLGQTPTNGIQRDKGHTMRHRPRDSGSCPASVDVGPGDESKDHRVIDGPVKARSRIYKTKRGESSQSIAYGQVREETSVLALPTVNLTNASQGLDHLTGSQYEIAPQRQLQRINDPLRTEPPSSKHLVASQSEDGKAVGGSNKRKRSNDRQGEKITQSKRQETNRPRKRTSSVSSVVTGSSEQTVSPKTKQKTLPKSKKNKPAFKRKSYLPERYPSWPIIIGIALHQAPQKRLRVERIYTWVEENFPLFKTIPCTSSTKWKNSIRHNLSYRPMIKPKPSETGEAETRTSSGAETTTPEKEYKDAKFYQIPELLQQNGVKGDPWAIDGRDDDDMRKLRQQIDDALKKFHAGELEGAYNYLNEAAEQDEKPPADGASKDKTDLIDGTVDENGKETLNKNNRTAEEEDRAPLDEAVTQQKSMMTRSSNRPKRLTGSKRPPRARGPSAKTAVFSSRLQSSEQAGGEEEEGEMGEDEEL